MTFRSHEPWDELISASLHGDLSPDEQARLESHLTTCATCRATLDAFADGRRIVGGLRHVPPPRDLGARVRAGIEGGSSVGLPWWRRPTAVFAGVGGGLAVVAGALLGLVLLTGDPDEPQLGDASATPTPSVVASASASERPSMPPETPGGSPTATTTPSPSGEPTPSPTVAASPEPDVYLALTGPYDNQLLTVRDGTTDELIMELEQPPAAPVAAELSPDGEWLAFIVPVGESGMNEIRVTHLAADGPTSESPVAVGSTATIVETLAGNVFLEQLAWSPDSRYLAFSVSYDGTPGVGAWVWEAASAEGWLLTEIGNAYAASWAPHPDDEEAWALWVSTAGADVASHLVPIQDGSGRPLDGVDPAEVALATSEGIFQPLLSPNGALAIYWRGTMAQSGSEWGFAEGGAPYLAEHRADAAGRERFRSERPLFSDLTIDGEAFHSAAITWGPDGETFAVWGVQWTGVSQGPAGERYPDETRVYFGRATDPRGLTRLHVLDVGDIPEGSRAVDVKIAPTGEHLVITAGRPRGGVLEAPRADLLLVKRNTGDVADEVTVLRSGDDGWFGPAAYDAVIGEGAP